MFICWIKCSYSWQRGLHVAVLCAIDWKDDVPLTKCRRFYRFMVCYTCAKWSCYVVPLKEKPENCIKLQKKNIHNRSKKTDITATANDMTTKREMTIAKQLQWTTMTAEIFYSFTQPYIIPGLPQTDGKEVEYRELMNGIQGCAQHIYLAFSDREMSAPIVKSLEEHAE